MLATVFIKKKIYLLSKKRERYSSSQLGRKIRCVKQQHVCATTVPTGAPWPPVNPLKPKLIQIIFNNSVLNSEKIHCFSIKKIGLFSKIIAVYSENHMKPVNILCGQNAVADC
jgi:hypothetical protein